MRKPASLPRWLCRRLLAGGLSNDSSPRPFHLFKAWLGIREFLKAFQVADADVDFPFWYGDIEEHRSSRLATSVRAKMN